MAVVTVDVVDEGCTCDDHPCTSLLQSGRAEPWPAPSCELPESAIVSHVSVRVSVRVRVRVRVGVRVIV